MTQLISILALMSLLACSQSDNGRSAHSASMKSGDTTKTETDDKSSPGDTTKDSNKDGAGESDDLKEDVVVIKEPEIKDPASKTPDIKVPVITDCYKGDAFICEIEMIIDAETNKLRATSGKSALVHSGGHSFISRQWSEAQALKARISHDGFPKDRSAAYDKEFGVRMSYFAENVAIASSSKGDAQAIAKQFVTMWWSSAGHKANMLGDYKSIGSGVAKKGNDYYATQLYSN